MTIRLSAITAAASCRGQRQARGLGAHRYASDDRLYINGVDVHLIIGAIGEIDLAPGGIMVVTAKSYGVTNMVALDRSGKALMEHPILVVGPVEKLLNG